MPSAFSQPIFPVSNGSADPPAGTLGEYVSGSNTATSLTTGQWKSAASISLTAGEWDVQGVAVIKGTSTTSFTYVVVGIATTLDGAVGFGGRFANVFAALVPGVSFFFEIVSPVTRIKINTTTTVYVNTYQLFTVSTATSDGYIRARRVG